MSFRCSIARRQRPGTPEYLRGAIAPTSRIEGFRMKINPSSAYQVGMSSQVSAVRQNEVVEAVARTAGAPSAGVAAKGQNVDQIKISQDASLKAELDQLARAVATDLQRPPSEERIAELRKAVQNNTYYVPTAALVDAIMNRWIGA